MFEKQNLSCSFATSFQLFYHFLHMATIKTLIRKQEKRADGTWNVLVRITHNRKSAYIRTSLFVEKKDITTSYKIKNASILDKCRELENEYRKKLTKLCLEFSNIELDYIIRFLEKSKSSSSIDFIEFCNIWFKKNKKLKGIKNYASAVNSFISFFGRKKIYCEEITSKTLRQFEEYLSEKKRASSMYPSAILKIFKDAREYYNDDEIGVYEIKHSIKYNPPKQNIADKRSLKEQQIKQIFELPYDNINYKGQNSRHDLAKDCFMLSFCLMGINSVDLYNAKEFDGEYLIYYRTKTTERRKTDKAKMVVKVHPFIRPIFDKYYSGKDYVFNFHERFSSASNFNKYINVGLKKIASEIGLETLQFYYVRHSFATIAVNKAKINKYIVNDMLCHVDSSMKVTELYIEKDYSIINEANNTLIEYMFGNK